MPANKNRTKVQTIKTDALQPPSMNEKQVLRHERVTNNKQRSAKRREVIRFTIQDLRNMHREAAGGEKYLFGDHRGGERSVQTHGHPVMVDPISKNSKRGFRGTYSFISSQIKGTGRIYRINKFNTENPKDITIGEQSFMTLAGAQSQL